MRLASIDHIWQRWRRGGINISIINLEKIWKTFNVSPKDFFNSRFFGYDKFDEKEESLLEEKFLRRQVPLPEDLTVEDIYTAMKKTFDFFRVISQKTEVCLGEIIQSNNFSGLVSNVFSRMLGETSIYKPYSDQRYPDLMHKSKKIGLEVKASNKPLKGGEGHNGHTGWHIIICFVLFKSGQIDISQIEVAYLHGFEKGDGVSDWKYQGSKRNDNNSQRTETYVTTDIGTAKLRDGSVYLNTNYVKITERRVQDRKRVALPIPDYSPFKMERIF